jgi:hypothetical protein
MSALEQVSVAEMENQAFALMARLHVILRRQNGRITDVEYMRQDPAYCRHVLDLAMKNASDDVSGICAKLETLFFGSEGLFVRVARQPLLAPRMANSSPVRAQRPDSIASVAPISPFAAPAGAAAPVSSVASASTMATATPQPDPDLPEPPRVEASYVGRLR